jgi:STE24 endopeptidase
MKKQAALVSLTILLCTLFLQVQGMAQSRPAALPLFAVQQTPASSGPTAPVVTPESGTQKRITAYTLSPDLYAKARNRSRIRFRFDLISFAYGLVVLWLILRWRIAPKYRDWAEKVSSNGFLQSLVYSPLLLLTMAVLTLPADIYDNSTERKFGLSVQSWASWAGDWVKAQLLTWVLAIVLIWILYLVIRRSTRRWWFYFWLISLPIGVLLFFLQPLIIDPMFHKFEPLQQKDPQLTASLEEMVRRSGEDIPPERMFWMEIGRAHV